MGAKTTLSQIAISIDEQAAAVESIVLSVVGRLAAWLGPVPVAILTSSELRVVFDVGPVLALISAASMELIGVNLANRWLTLKSYQDSKNKSDPDVNVKLSAWLMGLFYGLDVIIGWIIVARRMIDSGNFTYVIAGLFPIASILSVISLNQGVQLQRAMAVKKQEKISQAEERKRKAQEKKIQTELSKSQAQEKARQDHLRRVEEMESMSKRDRVLMILEGNGHLTLEQVGEMAGCTAGYVSKIKSGMNVLKGEN